MKLVSVRGHLFCRWDDPDGRHPFGKERFNLEGTCQGAHIVDDDYYRRWPEFLTDEMIERGGYLKSLTPEQEVAAFLALRGHCLEDIRFVGKACEVYRWSCRLAPGDPHYEAFLDHADSVRDRLIEEQTLRDYFGPDVPLPFGYFPRHVLRKMASDMILAETELFNQQNRAAQAQLAAVQRIDNRAVKPHQTGFAHQPPGAPQPWLGAPIPPDHGSSHSGFDACGLPIPPGIAAGMGVAPHPMYSDVSSFFGMPSKFDNLPARLLQQISSQQLAARRQEAVAISRALPPGIVIQQPRRPLLTPPETIDGHLETSNPQEP
jgi:hypothetical protein